MYEIYMKRALELALNGWGTTNPNPLVGAVIEKNGWIIGEGYHEKAGHDHAEVAAIKNSSQDVRGSTLYVNLEPCCHYGRTPPCVDTIIQSGISRVVIGMRDPNPKVAGKGIEILRKAGIEVVADVLQKESEKLNEIFIKFITHKKPFVIMKMAMTLDGKICTASGESKWISGEKSREYVHNLRNRVAAVMVGTNTVLKDNPYLTTRLEGASRNPTRIVLDRTGRIPLESNVFNNDARVLVAVSKKVTAVRIKELKDIGCKVIVLAENDGCLDLSGLMEELYHLEVDSILLEGGGNLNFSALDAGIVDKVIVFTAPMILGGKNSLTPVEGRGFDTIVKAIKLKNVSTKIIGGDILTEGYTHELYSAEEGDGCVHGNCGRNRCCKNR